MRLIAQLTLYNRGDFERLGAFLEQSYTDEARPPLDEQTALYAHAGRLRVQQVIAVEKHHAVVLLGSEKADYYYVELRVEADYPHHITAFLCQPMVEEA